MTAPTPSSRRFCNGDHWSFNEGSGTSASDRSGLGHTATLDGAAWGTGRYGGALSFDGVDDRANVADADDLDLTSALTLEAWVSPQSSTSARTLVAKDGPSGNVYALSLTADSKVRLTLSIGGATYSVTGASTLLDNSWTHVAGTYDGSQLKVWVDAVVDGTASASGSVDTSTLPLRIGTDSASSLWFPGNLDEIRIYNAALTSTQLADDRDASIDDLTPPTVVTTSPVASAINVDPATTVQVTFSEALDPASVSISTFQLLDPASTPVAASVSYNASTHAVTLTPSARLADTTTYTMVVRGGASAPYVTDVPGNALAATATWTFSTADATAPAVSSTTPASNARFASLSDGIKATFSEALDPSTVTTTSVAVRDTRNVLVTGSVAYDAPTRTVTFTPASPLLPTRPYSVTLSGAGATSPIRDVAGNALAGNYTWTFITTLEPSLIAAGNTFSIAVDDAGQVWTWGSNSFGERGTSLDGRLPGAVSVASSAKAVAAGANHAIALKNDGTLLSWGYNGEGQLGNGNTTSQSTPVAVSTLTNVVAIAAGRVHSVALKSDGTVWTWGAAGMIGDGANLRRVTPVQVTALSDVIAIAATNDHTLALKGDGTVWSWGLNTSGQLGDGTTTSPRLSPVQASSLTGVVGIAAGDYHSIAIIGSDLSLKTWGSNQAGQLGDPSVSQRSSAGAVPSLTNIRAVDGGAQRTLAAALDGSIKIWGASVTSTGSGSTSPIAAPGNPVGTQVAAGSTHQLSVTADGVVWAWSTNGSGQLGDGTTVNRLSAVSISETAYAWKVGTPILSYPTGTYSSVLSVSVTSATSGTTIRYATDGTDPTDTSTAVPTNGIVTVDQTMTLKTKAWKSGRPASNIESATYTMQLPALSLSPSPGTYTAPVSVNVSAFVAGAVIRYTTDGTDPTSTSPVYSTAISVNESTTIKVKSFKTGWTDSAVTTGVYTLKVATPTFSPDGGVLSAAASVTIATTTSGATIRYTTDGSEPSSTSAVYGGAVSVSSATTLRAMAFKTGWTPSATKVASYRFTYGAATTPTITPASGTYAGQVLAQVTAATGSVVRYTLDGTDPTATSPGYRWPLLLTATTTLKARAFSSDHTASAVATALYGLDDPAAVATPVLSPSGGEFVTRQTVTVSVATSGATIHYTTNGSVPTETDPTITSGSTITVDQSMPLQVRAFKSGVTASAVRRGDYVITGDVTAAGRSTYAIRADGSLWAWGYNAYGQLGDGTTIQRTSPVSISGVSDVVQIAAGPTHAVAVKRDGTVWSWGYNSYGQLGQGDQTARTTPTRITTLSDVVMVAAGTYHSIAVKRDGTVWAWGGNFNGQLGDGTTTMRTSPVQITLLGGVARVAAGDSFSLALQDDGGGTGIVWAWGKNDAGQVGDGTRSDRWSPVRVTALASVVSVGAGFTTAYAATADGELWGWGGNYYGQLGDGTWTSAADRVTPERLPRLGEAALASGGTTHAIALTSDGTAWAWGWNDSRQLGDGTTVNRNYADAVAITGALRTSAGEIHGAAVRIDGTVWAWGANYQGAIGDGSTVTPATPQAVPSFSLVTNIWLSSDPDADGIPTWRELRAGLDPLAADTNGDGLADNLSESIGVSAGNPDPDLDGLTTAAEAALGTDPFNADSDGDTVADGADAFPLDPTRSTAPVATPGDTTPPTITLTEPTNAVPVP